MAKTNQKSRRVQTSGKIGAGSPSVLTDVAEISAQQALPAEDKNVTSLYIVADNSDHVARSPIPFKSVENILQATAFASVIGYPLKYHLTIKWTDKANDHYSQILRKISEWQRYNCKQAAFVWAREAARGPHIHILLYLPKERASRFRKRLRHWLKKLLDLRRLPKGLVQCRQAHAFGDIQIHIAHRVRYILKGSDDDTRLFMNYCGKREDGHVVGKRSGTSQSLGVAARRRVGGALPSGHRKVTKAMREEALLRNERWAEERARYFPPNVVRLAKR